MQKCSDQILTFALTPLCKKRLWSNPSHRISRRMETWSSKWGNKMFPKGEIHWSDLESLSQLLWARYRLLCVWAVRLCLLPLADGIGILYHELIHPGERFREQYRPLKKSQVASMKGQHIHDIFSFLCKTKGGRTFQVNIFELRMKASCCDKSIQPLA